MQHFSKLHDLLVIWGESCYFSSALITTLQETIEDASTGNVTSTKDIKYSGELGGARDFGGDTRRDAPYTMPASHGDTSIPFYDLPTGNLMPCIEPNLMTPINPRSVYPLQFRVGPAEERLVQAVKCLLQNADFIYSANRSVNATEKSYINDLGQLVIYEKHSGEPTANEGVNSPTAESRVHVPSRGKSPLPRCQYKPLKLSRNVSDSRSRREDNTHSETVD
ncbi:MAG: hypothetical protein L6R35_006462 [Caloplaca aegaea]|nr:MAG: hypothetical protein L6R35_006462 [Caloplaca aegaea]